MGASAGAREKAYGFGAGGGGGCIRPQGAARRTVAATAVLVVATAPRSAVVAEPARVRAVLRRRARAACSVAAARSRRSSASRSSRRRSRRGLRTKDRAGAGARCARSVRVARARPPEQALRDAAAGSGEPRVSAARRDRRLGVVDGIAVAGETTRRRDVRGDVFELDDVGDLVGVARVGEPVLPARRRDRRLLRERARHLTGDGLDPHTLLKRHVERGAIVQVARIHVGGAQLDSARKHPLGAHRVAAAQQHFAEVAMRIGTLRADFAGLGQRCLRFGQQVRVEIHAPDGQHHVHVVHVPGAGAFADLTDQIVVMRRSQIRTQRDGGRRARIIAPCGEGLLERAHDNHEGNNVRSIT